MSGKSFWISGSDKPGLSSKAAFRLACARRSGHPSCRTRVFFEQYNHEPNVATLRFWRAFAGEERLTDHQWALLPAKQQAGEDALGVMERHLCRFDWFAGSRFTLADIALYAYTHVAEEGGFDLKRFSAVGRWLERVRSLPRHISM